MPSRLYKYLPSKYLELVLGRGALLFRSLSYFRRIEPSGRNDLLEGLHLDEPDHDTTLTTSRGISIVGRHRVLTSVNQDRLLIFCMSETLRPDLFAEFEADTCIEIVDTDAFLTRCNRAVDRQSRFSDPGLMHQQVEYYSPSNEVRGDITDPRMIPFFKHVSYARQSEYRLAVALQRGLVITKRIANELFTWDEDLASAAPTERTLYVGPLRDITVVHRASR